MNDCGIQDNNIRHEEALAVVEAFKAAGGKVREFGVTIKGVAKSTINKKSRAKPTDKPILAGLNPVDKFKVMLSHHKKLTRRQMGDHTGLAVCTISKCAKILEAEGFLTKSTVGAGIGREVRFEITKAGKNAKL